MKCVDCLPLIEEFFDGEVDDKTAERMRDHLAACAGCAEAYDALRGEQEMFLRYDRGLEVTPALWQGVRAAIAAADINAAPEVEPRPRSFLSTLREQLAAAVAVFAARPALASSMALLAVGVTAGALWFANSGRTNVTTPAHIADSNGGVRPAPAADETTTKQSTDAAPSPTAAELAQVNDDDTPVSGSFINDGPSTRDAQDTRRANPSAQTLTPDSRANTDARRGATGSGLVTFVDAGHGVAAEDSLPVVAPTSLAEANLADAAAVLDPEDEAISRHVARAQVLLRSIKNTRAAEGEGDLAYERELARKLLEENSSLQIDADADDNKKARKVLKELEPYLNDIANLRDKPAGGELRSIRERMEKQEIIAALHVYDD